jgi:hypothetical protein
MITTGITSPDNSTRDETITVPSVCFDSSSDFEVGILMIDRSPHNNCGTSASATNFLTITATPHIPVIGVIGRSATAILPTSSPVNEDVISVEFAIASTGNSIYGGVVMHTTKA